MSKSKNKKISTEVPIRIADSALRREGEKMKERRFSSYHSNGIIVGDNEKWIFIDDENREKMNDLIEKLIDDMACHRKMKSGQVKP